MEGNCNILTEELTREFSVLSEEDVEKPQSGKEVPLSAFEPGTSRL